MFAGSACQVGPALSPTVAWAGPGTASSLPWSHCRPSHQALGAQEAWRGAAGGEEGGAVRQKRGASQTSHDVCDFHTVPVKEREGKQVK